MQDKTPQKVSRFQRLITGATSAWNYFNTGVWSDPRRKWWINVVRTLNLSINSFLNRDIQTQACAMTYRTLLAVVPALALILAIGRGFGIQSVLQEELYHLFPAQKVAIQYAMNFVDSYLQQASEGIIVGVGILFLLYTLISLISNVEDTFNFIWGCLL
ncbi:MAG: YihY/virulence factor BrkB family protein [Muribaculaceae bacterium]|nr:YihY/virulence factor BrkB family protein [Muribaculaceae bacterium]